VSPTLRRGPGNVSIVDLAVPCAVLACYLVVGVPKVTTGGPSREETSAIGHVRTGFRGGAPRK